MEEARVTTESLVVSGRNPAKTLDVVKEDLDEVSKLVEFFVVAPSSFSRCAGWDHSLHAARLDLRKNFVGIIRSVGETGVAVNVVK